MTRLAGSPMRPVILGLDGRYDWQLIDCSKTSRDNRRDGTVRICSKSVTLLDLDFLQFDDLDIDYLEEDESAWATALRYRFLRTKLLS